MLRESLGSIINIFVIALIICLYGYISILKKDLKSCNFENQNLRLTFEMLQRESTKKETEYKKNYDSAVVSLNNIKDKMQKINAKDIGSRCQDSINWLKQQAIREGE